MSLNKEIKEFKKENDISLLAHYYVDGAIQEIADYTGDSFFLAQKATELDSKVILMAGVYFMGESIKILNPEKRVFMLNHQADCPMAHMVSVEKIQEVREKYNDLAVVCYVNSTAEIKGHSDVCVTSSNALKIIQKLKEKNIFFIPDKNLGAYVASFVPDKNIILNDGYCPVHDKIRAEDILALKEAHPHARVLAHPECSPEVLGLADFIGSTKGIIGSVKKSANEEFIIVTENGIFHELETHNPGKKLYQPEGFVCPDMKMFTVEDVLTSMSKPENEIFLDEEIAKKAYAPLKRMLELGADQ